VRQAETKISGKALGGQDNNAMRDEVSFRRGSSHEQRQRTLVICNNSEASPESPQTIVELKKWWRLCSSNLTSLLVLLFTGVFTVHHRAVLTVFIAGFVSFRLPANPIRHCCF
jgi:hypothetical protein